MTLLISVKFWSSSVRHLERDGLGVTLCGIASIGLDPMTGPQERAVPLCGNCARTNARFTTDRVEPEIETGATRRGEALAGAGRVREITGRIFRVAGSTDTYTIIIPSDRDLASTCTCMAAKTHPEIMCKHQSAVYLTIGGGE